MADRKLMKDQKIAIQDIYVPAKKRAALDQAKVDALAADILEKGLENPILVRRDDKRYVLVEGLHRLEAMKALGDAKITCLVVQAR